MKFIRMLNQEDATRWSESAKLNLKKKTFYNSKFGFTSDKKTIIFDLDETLVHCAEGPDLGDTNITISFPNGKEVSASIFIRPFA